MKDIVLIGAIRDRRYHYPKGFIDKRTGKKKTGFMPTSKGARLFVKSNLDNISKGEIKYDTLTPREKQVYKALTSDKYTNTFQFEGQKYYDPTGVIRNTLNKTSLPKNVKDLTNFLTKDQFKTLFKAFTPANKLDKLNTSLFEFNKGAKQERFRTNRGDLLDVSSQLKKLEKKGYLISVDGKSGRDAILYLKQWENQALEDQLEKSRIKYENGDPVKVQILHKVNIDPFSKEIHINTKQTQVNEFYPQELLDKIRDKKEKSKNKK
jgi:hypothetical protein